ncbi:hypothetical protein [Actinomadura rupiterrae]|uniref:hypothetical protein n=1 Tax=Actinomadura rupiterrae TaxID=559627 RepID=UPI0020A44433|nr:hypothetical protein [Actinomadura rupiterrae]MCP2341763.1 hypothetical protein [Actinomadura rupiterrae]
MLRIGLVGGVVLAAGIALAAPASADTGHAVGGATRDGAGTVAAAGKAGFHRIGKIHRFRAQGVRGASVWGDWYWAQDAMGKFVWMDIMVKDTRADGKSAGFCYDLTSPKAHVRNKCKVNTLGAGKTLSTGWSMSYWKQDRMRIRSAVGKLDRKRHIFYTSSEGAWLRLR